MESTPQPDPPARAEEPAPLAGVPIAPGVEAGPTLDAVRASPIVRRLTAILRGRVEAVEPAGDER
jgi:hypothetical protein